MLDPHGFVNTTNSCNFFIVRRGEVWTSTGDYCMNGVTRGKVIEVCRANGIPVFEKNYSLYEAYSADEAFLTGTFGAQTPVASIDGKPVAARACPVAQTPLSRQPGVGVSFDHRRQRRRQDRCHRAAALRPHGGGRHAGAHLGCDRARAGGERG